MFGKSFEDKVQSAVETVRGQFPNAQINVRVDNETVTLTGHAPDIDTKGRIMAAFNAAVETKNTINQIAVNQPAGQAAAAPAPQPHAAAAPQQHATATGVLGTTTASEPRTHTVTLGETLSAIAKHYYGDASKYHQIFEANRDQLKDPDKIQVGQKLKIPG